MPKAPKMPGGKPPAATSYTMLFVLLGIIVVVAIGLVLFFALRG
jgi:hypothetical protein